MPNTTRGPAVEELALALREAEGVTALCHENPDADTIGGAIAMALVARRLGKPSEVVSTDGIPPAFDFLPLVDEVRRAPELPPGLAVVCDAATLERIGRVADDAGAWLRDATLVNIDHHVTNSGYGRINLVDAGAAATCQVIAEALPALGVALDREIATALLTGVVRDSHGFSDGSTSAATLRVAADLVEAGAPIALIQRRVLADLPVATLALWGRMLGGIGERLGGRIVHATLTQAMLDDTGTAQHDADGVAEFLARARDVDVAILVREIEPGTTRVSLRTSDRVDASAIAARFGGGGHALRAGCSIPLPVDEALDRLLATCEAVLGER